MTTAERIKFSSAWMDQILGEAPSRSVSRMLLSREPFAVTDSHLGGTPYVPRDKDLPTNEDGEQLWLCAQINFAQVPPLEGFPREGMLQIFLPDWDMDGGFGLISNEATEQIEWRAVWYDTVDESVTEEECRAKMAVPWEEASKERMLRPPHKFDLEEIAKGNKNLWRAPDVPLKVTFAPVEQEPVFNEDEDDFDGRFQAIAERELPGEDWIDFHPRRMIRGTETEAERAEIDALRLRLEPAGGCKLGGTPLFLQDDPREYDPELEEWSILLLQLDDDSLRLPGLGDMDLYLGGCGTMNFLIRPEDLSRRDVSRVLAQWSCT